MMAHDQEIILTRLLKAPRALVFRAWTDPKHVAQWWGPDGFTNTVQEIDVRPGGVWRFIMHDPDGVDYPNNIVFNEVVEPERLVYDHGNEGSVDRFHVAVTFEDAGDQTRLTMRSRFASAAARTEAVEEFGAVEGGNQHLNRLEQYLTTM
ncbi:MAG: ATPase [Dehalococcoidia bacterium]|nr:MAG: ATPase [Dehalococcoidia bacterium]